MIERKAFEAPKLADAVPELKISVQTDDSVEPEWKKTGFDMLELQYRKEGAAMWQYTDKSTEKTIAFTPPLTASRISERFEFRAIYVIKNQRAGQ